MLANLVEEITDKATYMLTTEEICRILRKNYGIEFSPWKIKELTRDNVFFRIDLYFNRKNPLREN